MYTVADDTTLTPEQLARQRASAAIARALAILDETQGTLEQLIVQSQWRSRGLLAMRGALADSRAGVLQHRYTLEGLR